MFRHLYLIPAVSLLICCTDSCKIWGGEIDHLSGQRIRTLLVPTSESVISSQLSGRIVSIKEQVGGNFIKDELLVRFDCAELDAKLVMAEAEHEIATLTAKAKKELLILQSAGETEVALAVAAAEKARAQVTLQKVIRDACEIKAPFEGSVVKISAKPFQSVNQGQPLLEIVSNKAPKARFNIPSRWLGWLKSGTRFNLTVDETGRTYTGKIAYISARVDAVSQTVEVEGELENGGNLLAGMSGYATFKYQGKSH